MLVEEGSMKGGLRREDVLRGSKWSVGVDKISAGLRCIWPATPVGELPDLTHYSLFQKLSLRTLLSN